MIKILDHAIKQTNKELTQPFLTWKKMNTNKIEKVNSWENAQLGTNDKVYWGK